MHRAPLLSLAGLVFFPLTGCAGTDARSGAMVRDSAGVVLPAGLRVQAIGRDWLLGIWRDELDVSYVRLHRIIAADDAE